jgi:hypothetical protein
VLLVGAAVAYMMVQKKKSESYSTATASSIEMRSADETLTLASAAPQPPPSPLKEVVTDKPLGSPKGQQALVSPKPTEINLPVPNVDVEQPAPAPLNPQSAVYDRPASDRSDATRNKFIERSKHSAAAAERAAAGTSAESAESGAGSGRSESSSIFGSFVDMFSPKDPAAMAPAQAQAAIQESAVSAAGVEQKDEQKV